MPNTPVRAAAEGLSDYPQEPRRFGFFRELLNGSSGGRAMTPATHEDNIMNASVDRRSVIAATAVALASGTALPAAAKPRIVIEDVIRAHETAHTACQSAAHRYSDAEDELMFVYRDYVKCPPFEGHRVERRCSTPEQIDEATQEDWFEAENQDLPLQQERTRVRLAIREGLKEELAGRLQLRAEAKERLQLDELEWEFDRADELEQEARRAFLAFRPADRREAAVKRDYLVSTTFFQQDPFQCEPEEYIQSVLLALCDAPESEAA